MKKIYLAAFFAAFLAVHSAKAQILDGFELNLVGAEIAVGVDIGDTRYGTRFVGKALFEGEEIGYWTLVLNFKDYELIEVCDGTNDIVWLRMTLLITRGEYAGKQLILGFRDRSGTPDVFWDSLAPVCNPLTDGSDCVCPGNLDDIVDWDCDDGLLDGYGPIATIPELRLDKKRGSTLNISGAYLSGFLCHNYPLVPRAGGTLLLEIW